MLNQTILVGRLVKDVEVNEIEGGKNVANITLAIPRSFKNSEGEYDTDFVDCALFGTVASNTAEYCHKGDLVGIKGRLQKGKKDNKLQIIVDRVTFMSGKKDN